MKRNFLKLMFILCLFPISFAFSACSPNVVDLKLDGELEIYIGSFSLDNYTLTIVMSDQTTKEITLSEEYVSAEDLAKLSTSGTHSITINYGGYSEEFTIVVKKYTFSDLAFNDVTYTYDGTAKTIAVENLPSGASVDYSISNTQINAGEYEIIATVTLENYETQTLNATLKINKAVYDMSGVSFSDKYVTYNGETHFVEIEGNLPEGVSVEYLNNDQPFGGRVNVGTSTVTAKFTGDSDNYELIQNKTATLNINRASYDLSGISFTNKTVTYDGTVHSMAIVGELPEGLTVRYLCNSATFTGKKDAGTYTIVASFTNSNSNYYGVGNMTATLKIERADFDMTGISFVGDTFTYDELKKSIEISGTLPSGVSVKYYYNGSLLSGVYNAGEYEVEARFSHSNKNYNAISSKYATLIIEKANFDSSTIKFEDKTVTYDKDAVYGIFVEGDLPSSISVSYYCNGETFYFTSEVGTYIVTAKFSSSNYNTIQDRTATLVINKAVYDMSAVSMVDKTEVYDGELKSIQITGTLPNGVSVMYYYNDVRCNGVSEHGEYNVVAKFVGDYTNYEQIPNISATLIITRATHTITFRQDGQPDIIKYVLDMADFTDIPEPNNEGVEKGYGYVWQEADYSCVKDSFVVLAEFKKMVYNITYDYGTATVPSGSPRTYMVDTETIVLPIPTLDGHTLFGLYANDNFKQPITEIPKGSTGDIKITAWFDIVTPGLTIGGGTVISYNGTAKNVYIPEVYNGSTVTEIYDNAFKGKDIQVIMLPETLTWIGSNAFENCTSLYKVHIPSAVNTIEWYTFKGCSSLEIVTFGDGIKLNYSTEIPKEMFSGCSSLKEIIIPKSFTRIGDRAFYNCFSLEKLVFEEGCKMTTIGSYNFNDCLITEVVLYDSDVWIGLDVFKNCKYLKTFTIGEGFGLTAACEGSFENCVELTSIVISRELNLPLFSEKAFTGCINLKTVYNYCTRLNLVAGGTNYDIEKYAKNIYTSK